MTFPVTEHTVKTARHTTGYLACGETVLVCTDGIQRLAATETKLYVKGV
jgi:hypothetical protein